MKIDLVYCWVNKDDPSYIKRNKKYLKNSQYNFENKAITFRENNEIIYSLRSVEKYIPWVNNIYIVTDKQCPSQLNLKNKKIHIIDQSIILPDKNKPCFNTASLEASFYKIPGISEYFLLASDDYFVGKKLDKSYFFTKTGKPIYSVHWTHFSGSNKYNVEILASSVAGMNLFSPWALFSHTHNIVPNRVSHWKYMVEHSEYKNSFNATRCNMYRNVYDISRHLVNLYFHKKGEVILRKTRWYKETYLTAKFVWLLKFIKPNLFCINDNCKINKKNQNTCKKFLNKMFPKKSSFEI
ncbi:MAG: hypothetical protein LBB95_01320 [Mycoplasmataceae bacterium]|nr:hypothetical protein [Mycoplasmataceae bacterium]